MVDVARGHALEELGEDAIGVLEALLVFCLAHAVVAVLVLLRAQLAPAEMVDEVHLCRIRRTPSVVGLQPTASRQKSGPQLLWSLLLMLNV